MITDEDIKKLKTIFATKDDLKRFATKDDLKRFATKDDLKRYATKEDLRTTTRDILDLIGAFRKEFKEDIASFKDEILYEIKKLREEVIVVGGYRDMIEDHEQRIARLEAQKVKIS